ncbi:MAG TPA: Gfo/Idh/MocA family oxidoreductase [Spirochaetia bacterium]|nr:Gfo/Idh/MocA family oxidoreductase [Spirochaetia bacterium]
MANVKIGMIGAGAIAPTHCRGIQGHPAAEIVAVADVNEERARALAREFAIPKVYTDVKQMLAERAIDAVTIALPTYLHAVTAEAAIEAGKHVFLDKPFVMNQGEATRLMKTAAAKKKILTVGMNQRFTPEAQAVRAVVERGDLGDIYHAKAYWCRRSGIPRFGTWFGDKSKAGGGALLDIGFHMLDLGLHLIGNFRPLTVSGFSYTKFGNRDLGEGKWGKSDPGEHVFDVDDYAGALIRLTGGVTLQVETSWARHQALADMHDVELFGTEGGASVYPAKVYQYVEEGRGYRTVEPAKLPVRYPHFNRHHNWIDAILGDAALECTLEQAYAVQRIIDGVYESARIGSEVKLS